MSLGSLTLFNSHISLPNSHMSGKENFQSLTNLLKISFKWKPAFMGLILWDNVAIKLKLNGRAYE